MCEGLASHAVQKNFSQWFAAIKLEYKMCID